MPCNEIHLRCFLFIAQRLVIAVHMHNEEQVRYAMQCNEIHLRCFLFIAQRLVIAVHMHNEKQVGYVMQCNETHLRCFLFTSQMLVIACICITRNKLDMSCNALKHILGVFFSLPRG